MTSGAEKKQLIKAWTNSAKEDLKIADDLFTGKHYSYSLFFCQLSLEKLLKSIFINNKDKYPPPIHDLVRLSRLSKAIIDQQQKEHLAEITTFNTEARYDIFKQALYKKATKGFTLNYLNVTKQIFKHFKNQL